MHIFRVIYERTRQLRFTSVSANLGHQIQAFENAANFFESAGRAGANECSSEDCERAALLQWAQERNALIPSGVLLRHTLMSDMTSEHKVYFRERDLRAIKITNPGFFGQIPSPGVLAITRKNSSPSEYLRRMALQIRVFDSDIRLEGVTVLGGPSMVIGEPIDQPSFVISQEWFDKCEAPSMDEISDRMKADSFVFDPSAYFGWYRPEDYVVVVDAKPDNFIKSSAGLVPIDLQMRQFTPDEFKRAGLLRPQYPQK